MSPHVEKGLRDRQNDDDPINNRTYPDTHIEADISCSVRVVSAMQNMFCLGRDSIKPTLQGGGTG